MLNRLRELDFIRGLAIILVLFRHQYLFEITQKIGWIGVDLFFVLSGFLVSGLLFREYGKYGNVRPGLFLIRRGFKIYPVYYLFYIPYLTIKLLKGKFELKGFLADMFFLQNYVTGWGWAYAPSWSLAVEEHFYFGFALLTVFGIFTGMLTKKIGGLFCFEYLVALLIVFVSVFRALSFSTDPDYFAVSMTHLRIDSMLAGVLVSCAWNFHREGLQVFYRRFRWMLLLSVPALLSCSFVYDQQSAFMSRIGYSLLYIGFSFLLLIFLCEQQISRKLDRIFSPFVVNGFARIGLASYSIYVIHTLVNYLYTVLLIVIHVDLPLWVNFLLTSGISIAAGILMTRYVENWFLGIRDRYFPSRSAPM